MKSSKKSIENSCDSRNCFLLFKAAFLPPKINSDSCCNKKIHFNINKQKEDQKPKEEDQKPKQDSIQLCTDCHGKEWIDLCLVCQENCVSYYQALGYTKEDNLAIDAEEEDTPPKLDVQDGEINELEEGEVEEGEDEQDMHDDEQLFMDQDFQGFDPSQDPATRKLIFLTPQMIQMFRSSEVFRMEKRALAENENGESTSITSFAPIGQESNAEFILKQEIADLKRQLQDNFENAERAEPSVLWPVLSLTF